MVLVTSTGALMISGQGSIWPDLLSPAGPAYAQPAEDKNATRKKLQERETELKTTRERESELAKNVAEIDAEREKLRKELMETSSLVQQGESQMSAIESRLDELQAKEKFVRGSLDQRQEQISSLLAVLQRMGRNPPPVMITRRSDALEMVRSAMLLSSAFPKLAGEAQVLETQLTDLVRVMDEIRSESQRLKAETARLNDAKTKLAGLVDERKKSLEERRGELASVRKAAADISRSVSDLNELITKLDQAVTSNTGLGNYEKEVAAAPAEGMAGAAQASQPKPSGPLVVTPDSAAAPGPATGTEKQVALNVPKQGDLIELKPKGKGGYGGANSGRMKPALPFQEARGQLPWPAMGRTVLNFGEKTQYGGASKGVVLETRGGAQINSPCDGWVVYAGEFRSYGQLLIINAGGGYHILLAGLSRIDVEPGQFVLAAEPVGTMSGTVAPRESKNESSAPVLYVEFRKEGNPIDPSPWWAAGPEKVQG